MLDFAQIRRAGALAMLLLGGAVACGTDDTTEQTAAGTIESATALEVTEVRLGKAIDGAQRVTDETDDFNPGDMVYASVATSGAATGATVMARWTFEDGEVMDETTVSISPTGDAVTAFHISQPDGLPVGDYRVEVTVNGESAETKDFRVDND